MADGPDVSVVIPCHAAAATVADTLAALKAQTIAPGRFEVIVVDPAVDGTHRLLERVAADWPAAPPLRVLRSPLAGGPAVKRNFGAGVARGLLLAFTDADCAPDPGWLAAGLQAFADGFDLVQGRTLAPDGDPRSLLAHGVEVVRDVGLHETCNIFYARELFERLGGFGTHYFKRYGAPFGEDADLGWRARRAGAAYRFEPEAVVRHPRRPITLASHLREQWLARGFPELVRELPELRESLLYRRLFLTRRSAMTAAAVAGVALSRITPAALLLALPYALYGLPPGADARALATQVVSDTVLEAGLVAGSVRARTLVI